MYVVCVELCVLLIVGRVFSTVGCACCGIYVVLWSVCFCVVCCKLCVICAVVCVFCRLWFVCIVHRVYCVL